MIQYVEVFIYCSLRGRELMMGGYAE